MTDQNAVAVAVEVQSVSKRDAIRAAFFNQKIQAKTVTVAGIAMEIRQPAVGDIMMMQVPEGMDSRKYAAAKVLCDYCYVPGTDEKVFDQADIESILAVPFSGDWVKLQTEIDSLTDIMSQLETATKN
jgi:hypothetical protein